MKKVCPICFKEFEAKNKKRIYCYDHKARLKSKFGSVGVIKQAKDFTEYCKIANKSKERQHVKNPY